MRPSHFVPTCDVLIQSPQNSTGNGREQAPLPASFPLPSSCALEGEEDMMSLSLFGPPPHAWYPETQNQLTQVGVATFPAAKSFPSELSLPFSCQIPKNGEFEKAW